MKKLKYHEIRLDKEGKEDDIVVQCDQIHLERMDKKRWWLGVYKGNKMIHFDIYLENGSLNVYSRDDDMGVKIIKPEEPHD